MDEIQNIAQRVHRSCGIQHHASLASMIRNVMQRAIEMYASFLVHGNPAGARFGKCGNKVIGIFDHQVAIKNRFGERLAQPRYNRRADGDVWHKMTVHDVYVQERTSAIERLLRVRCEIREIRGEDGRRELNRAWQDLCSWTLHSLYVERALRWPRAPARKSRGNRRATWAPLHALTRRHSTMSSCPNLFRAPLPNHLPSPDDPHEAALPADPKYVSRKRHASPECDNAGADRGPACLP